MTPLGGRHQSFGEFIVILWLAFIGAKPRAAAA
jgi:hypothetical protein